MKNYWFKVLLILLYVLPFVGYTQGNISASTTPATCVSDGTLTIAIPDGTINSRIIYFVYSNSIGFYLESESPVFTDLDSGDYYYGYYGIDDFTIYEESTEAINVGSVCAEVQIRAVSTSALCPGTGEITVSVTNLNGPILYGVVKSPYNEANIIVSTNPVVTNLDIGDYYYGYFSGSTFVKANKTINVGAGYSTESPTITKVTAQNFTYCSEGSADPLGEILVECNGGNPNYAIILTKVSDGSEVKRVSGLSWYRFTDVSPGNYKVKVTDRCGTTVFYPLEVSLSANVPLTDFAFKKRNSVDADIVYNTPGNVCSGMSSATIKMYYLAEAVSMAGMTPPFYKQILLDQAFTCTYKLEIQNGDTWEVYDNLKMTIGGDYDRNFSLPLDRSKWGLVRLTATTCGMSKTITQDYGGSSLAKSLSFDVASFKFSNDPANTNCSRTGKIELKVFVNLNMGCSPYTLEVIDTETNDKTTYTSTANVAQNNISCLLQIGKTYSFKLKDSSGAEPVKSYFTYFNDSGSGLTLGNNLKSLFIDPAIFGPAQKDKAKVIFYTGPSGAYFGKSILVASYPVKKSNFDVGLEGEVTISLESGPSVLEISKGSVILSGSDDYSRLMNFGFLGLGNNLVQGTYKIRVKDSGCFDEVFEVVLDSYFTGIKITDVSYTPEANVCDRYIKKVTVKVDVVGDGTVPKDLEYISFVSSDGTRNVNYVSKVYAQTVAGPVAGGTGTGTTWDSGVFLKGGTLELVYKLGELPGNYEIGLSREYFFYGFLKSDKLWENTATMSLSVKHNFIVFDLSQSGGVVCLGNTTGDLHVKVKNVATTEIVTYFIKKDTDKVFPVSGQTSPVFKGLEAGNYVVRAKTTCYEVDQALILRALSDPLIKGKSFYCKGDSLKLDISEVGPVSSIRWTLPDGTSIFDITHLALDNITASQSGSYKVEVNTIGGCNFTESVNIIINDLQVPTGAEIQKFCKVNNNTIADLVTTETGVIWYDAATGGNAVASTTVLEDNKVYYGSLKAGTCESPTRLAVTVILSDPKIPTTSKTTQEFCKTDNKTIADLAVTESGVTWYDAATGGNAVASTTTLESNKVYYGSLKSGTCESPTRLAVTVTLSDPQTPTTSKTTQEFCKSVNATVANLVTTETEVIWYSEAVGGTAIEPTTILTNGTVYYGSLKAGTCESSKRLEVKAIIENCTAESPHWNSAVCVFDEATYKVASGMSDYNWIVSKEGVIVAGGESTDDYVTVVWNSAGEATVKADYIDASKFNPLVSIDFSIAVNSCSDVGLKKTVDNPTPGIGHQVVFTITAENLGTNAAKEVVISEKLPSGYDYVTSQTSSGSYNSIDGIWTLPVLKAQENQTLKITAKVKELGDYLNVAYLKTSNPIDINETNNRAEASIVIEDVIVYNAISVNGDGLNDYFKIVGLHNYPNNTVEIFNRNGVQIFKTHNYGSNHNVFRGISEGRATISKKSGVPTGTYFYILRYEIAGVFREKAGYLYVTNN